MELKGLGNDIIEIERIEKALLRTKSFKEKVYTKKEIEYAEKKNKKYETFAGKFAAKEAIAKAFGTGVRDFSLIDIEILNDSVGKPYVVLKESLKEKYQDYKIEISISHSKTYAIATAILIKK